MFGKLQVDDRVRFVRTSDKNLDGICGTIYGKSIDWSQAFASFYIVVLDTPYLGEKAINITEACLEKI